MFVLDGDRVRKREVEVGIRGTRAVEVLSGLSEGERVASPAPTDLQRRRARAAIAAGTRP